MRPGRQSRQSPRVPGPSDRPGLGPRPFAIETYQGIGREEIATHDSASSAPQAFSLSSIRMEPTRSGVDDSSATHAGISGAIQRYRDVKDYYEYNQLDESEEGRRKKALLDDYSEIQKLLSDPSRVRPILYELSEEIRQERISLPEALSRSEEGIYSPSRPLFTKATTAPNFHSVIGKGQMFEDFVSEKHGSQTHRLQWHIIKRAAERDDIDFSIENPLLSLYKGAVSSDWRKSPGGAVQNMWDRIVDESAGGDTDFTNPEALERYLTERPFLETLFGDRLASLRQAARHEKQRLLSTKAEVNRQAPEMEALAPERSMVRGEFDRHTTSRVVDGGKTWTGWTLGSPEEGAEATTMYPEGQDPDAEAPRRANPRPRRAPRRRNEVEPFPGFWLLFGRKRVE